MSGIFEIYQAGRFYARFTESERAKYVARHQSLRYENEIWVVEDKFHTVIAKYQNGSIIA